MIESLYILKSKIRRDMLTLFFTNSANRYYLRELERILGYSAGSIRREILKFERDGLFNIKKEANLVYYSLNLNHPVYNELKSIIFKTTGVQKTLTDLVMKYDEIKTVFIFGSYARNDEGKNSDIDVVIVGKTPGDKFLDEIRGLEDRLKREINYNTYTEKEFEKEKKKKGGFLNAVIEDKIIVLKGDVNG